MHAQLAILSSRRHYSTLSSVLIYRCWIGLRFGDCKGHNMIHITVINRQMIISFSAHLWCCKHWFSLMLHSGPSRSVVAITTCLPVLPESLWTLQRLYFHFTIPRSGDMLYLKRPSPCKGAPLRRMLIYFSLGRGGVGESIKGRRWLLVTGWK